MRRSEKSKLPLKQAQAVVAVCTIIKKAMVTERPIFILQQAYQWAFQEKVPIVLASTTGETAQELLRIMGVEKVRLVVVSHDNRQVPKEWRFNAEIADELKEQGFPLLRNFPLIPLSVRLLRRITDTFGISTTNRRDELLEEMLGTGGRVCFQIARLALEAREIREHDKFVAVAGERSGANIALLLQIESSRPIRIALLEIIARFKPALTGS